MKTTFKSLYFILCSALLLLSCDSTTSPELNSTLAPEQGSLNKETFKPNSQGANSNFNINEDNLDVDWVWVRETGNSGDFEFTEGPDTPIIGNGSATFRLSSAEDGVALIGGIFDGNIRLDELQQLEYNTYQSDGTDSQSISIQFNMNYLDDGDNSWQGRLVFEPYYDESTTISQGEWQSWNALELLGWWATGAPGNEVCSISDPCTFQEVLDAFPDAEIRTEPNLDNVGLIHFKGGSNWGIFEGSVDGFLIEYQDQSRTFNFTSLDAQQEFSNPEFKEDCKNGGWVEYGFRNQGQCIRFVNTGQDSRGQDNGEENGDDNGNGEENGGDNGNGEENGDDNGNGENGVGNGNGNNGNGAGNGNGNNGNGVGNGNN